jgi:hypothetical protein
MSVWSYIYVLILIASSERLFYLVPWYHIKGVFNSYDIGNFLIILGLFYVTIIRKNLSIFNNRFSLLIFFYFIILLVQVVLAEMFYGQYGQSYLDGLIGVRHKVLYYVSFYVFVHILKTREDVVRLLDFLTVISAILLLLSLVNYFNPVVFHHFWAEGHGERSGIKRALIPGMELISLTMIWQFCCWIENRERSHRSGMVSLLFLLAIFFRQTRGRLIGVISVVVGLLLIKRRFRPLAYGISVGLVSIIVANFAMEKNIFLEPFRSASSDISSQSGTWKDRLDQLRVDLEVFEKHPWLGSGTACLRGSSPNLQKARELRILAQQDDLGYTHWLKMYGVPGVIWLLLFFYLQYRLSWKLVHEARKIDRLIGTFCLSFLGYIAVSFVTLPHFIFPRGTILLCLVSAILVRVHGNITPANR